MSGLMEYLQLCFSGANLPASVLLTLVMVYWLLVILAGLDLDLLDFDLDMDAEPDLESALSLGFVALRFFNIGRVPLMIWVSIFAVSYWLVSMLLDRLVDDPANREAWFFAIQYGVRNFALSVALTKLFTQPLCDKFEAVEPNKPAQLIGQACEITSSEVTDTFGQATVVAEASPLTLHVRTRTEPLAKGDTAIIEAYDPEKNLYFVSKANAEE